MNIDRLDGQLKDEHARTLQHIQDSSSGKLFESWKSGMVDADLEAKRALDEKLIEL